jgi:hypothetical protein
VTEVRDHAKKTFNGTFSEDDKWLSIIELAKSRLSHPSKYKPAVIAEVAGRKVEVKL